MIQKVGLQKITVKPITPKPDQIELSELKEGQTIPINGAIIATSCVRHEQWGVLDTFLRKNPRTITVVLSPENQTFLFDTNLGINIKRYSKKVIISNETNGLTPVA